MGAESSGGRGLERERSFSKKFPAFSSNLLGEVRLQDVARSKELLKDSSFLLIGNEIGLLHTEFTSCLLIPPIWSMKGLKKHGKKASFSGSYLISVITKSVAGFFSFHSIKKKICRMSNDIICHAWPILKISRSIHLSLRKILRASHTYKSSFMCFK